MKREVMLQTWDGVHEPAMRIVKVPCAQDPGFYYVAERMATDAMGDDMWLRVVTDNLKPSVRDLLDWLMHEAVTSGGAAYQLASMVDAGEDDDGTD